ncbi:hypothetical protein LHYA1_G005964 [Lachnellula hyalina]|uniref:Helix-turn-helix domain-containing protein n=1 Tax=Lachnellula hyalina TaxID=1316788 RepID=A0A8H8QYJ4_9HELO|nr:uncharacterized protein LHYA1_G005964 [Lachnellula hyalina]TVY25109.1 hypothetical protein LHYA1_G005964 [Lachnellula hyalina]
MGNASSKAASKAASVSKATTKTARKYPTRSPPTSTSSTPSAQPFRSSPSPTATNLGPQVHPEPKATSTRDRDINRDASDPDFAARLQQLGPVQPNPTYSASSTFHAPSPPATSTNTNTTTTSSSHASASSTPQFRPSSSAPSQFIFPQASQNPAVSLLTARYRLAEEADREFESIGRRGARGRSFLDVVTLRQVLVLRERGVGEGEIEKRLELREGTVGAVRGEAGRVCYGVTGVV